MKKWFAAYLDWLQTSKNGKEEAEAKNNHGTWYDAQVVSLALTTGQKDLAKKTLEAAKKKRIESQIEEDGSEPLELARTNSLGYSLMNTRSFLELATMGDKVGVDLWHTRIKNAIDYLAPYVDESKVWPHQQIDGVKKSNRIEIATLLRRAARAYKDPKYEVWICNFDNEWQSSRTQILWPPTMEAQCH
jgi:hypothetical protein